MVGNVLVTGSGRGLGAYLARQLAAQGLNRANADEILSGQTSYHQIIHCAFAHPQSNHSNENLVFLERLLGLRCENFVFISSSDVYPDDLLKHDENEPLFIESARSEYARQKILCENMILKRFPEALILRPCTLLDYPASSQNISLLLDRPSPILTLTAHSTLNFIGADEILKFIRKGPSTGIYNLNRNKPMPLSEMAGLAGKKPTYGTYHYAVSQMCNRRALAYLPDLNESAHVYFEKYLRENY